MVISQILLIAFPSIGTTQTDLATPHWEADKSLSRLAALQLATRRCSQTQEGMQTREEGISCHERNRPPERRLQAKIKSEITATPVVECGP